MKYIIRVATEKLRQSWLVFIYYKTTANEILLHHFHSFFYVLELELLGF
jgi:hypothetical protein